MSDELRPEYDFDCRQAKPNRFAAGPTVQMKSLAEVSRQAIEILSRELGAADMLRFLGQFTTGHGDYTAAREGLFGQATLGQIIAEIKSAETVSSTDPVEIYVPLLNEGTDVLRPTRGLVLGTDIVQVLATTDYDPAVEEWQFPPGSKVRCVSESRGDRKVLVARSRVA